MLNYQHITTLTIVHITSNYDIAYTYSSITFIKIRTYLLFYSST